MTFHDDDGTRIAARAGADQLDTFLTHFTDPEGSWDTFGKDDYYVEVLRLHTLEILLCIERELQSRAAVEPTDFGS